MIKFEKVHNLSNIQGLRDKYFMDLPTTMDGMWISIINSSEFYEIYYQTNLAGYFSLSSDGILIQFFLDNEFLHLSQDIFTKTLLDYSIQIAHTFTFDPLFFSLCLDFHRSLSIHTYLFQDSKRSVSEIEDDYQFIQAEEGQFQAIIDFYQKNTDMDGLFLNRFVSELITDGGCFILFNKNHEILGIGELRKNIHRPSFVDLGVIVSAENRSKGIGTCILTKLNKISNQKELESICSCESDNIASKRMIEKAGFITNKHRLCLVRFE
ncbi:GNAT family N-acetyltransferase [Cohnella sp. WQ 127256]|uniref:GNAT family N-acetyltransferase n=1 Tax=Cohnella sp. WQ 127256 TaxID=2938790 RepID=UPI002118BDF7|nr:GNAT family N-acetyltransferase [Cohnella sp. WQ 127256]